MKAMTPTPWKGSMPTERWPSREPVRDGQISIRAPLDVIGGFRSLCKDDRCTYADMLSILMDAYENRSSCRAARDFDQRQPQAAHSSVFGKFSGHG